MQWVSFSKEGLPMPWHYKVSRPSAATHLNVSNMPKHTGSGSNTNDILNIKPKQILKYSIFQNHALGVMSRMTEPHVAMTAKQQSFIYTNITVVVIHSVRNCRNMVVNYVLHPYDIIMEQYAYEKRRMKADNLPGDPTPISFQTCRRHEWLTRWNSPGVTAKWINYYHFLSYITNPILYEPIDLIHLTHHDNVPI